MRTGLGLSLLLASLLVLPVPAQSLRVLSEFQRVGPFGEVVSVDRTPEPREIISPAVARNAFASFHIAVSVPEREPFFLYVQTNPPNVFQISVYDELYVKAGAGWIPDALQPVRLPAFGILPYLPLPVPGQNTLSYWLDVWVPAETAIQRVRLEVLVKIGRGWLMYPMEVRVTPAVAPTITERDVALPEPEERADASVIGPFGDFLCNARERGRDKRLSVRRLVHRNAVQDLALARALAGRDDSAFRDKLLSRAGVADRDAWCKSPSEMGQQSPEWFVRVRDWIYRQAGPGPY
jgi:hypothetical protein